MASPESNGIQFSRKEDKVVVTIILDGRRSNWVEFDIDQMANLTREANKAYYALLKAARPKMSRLRQCLLMRVLP